MLSNLIITFVLFSIVFFIQVFIWNFRKIKREIFTLFLIYLSPILLIINFYWYFDLIILDILIIGILYILLSLAYLQTYPALREDIPSFRILFLIEKSQKKGITKKNIEKKIINKSLLYSKYNDLLNDSMIYHDSNGDIRLTFFSSLLLYFFSLYRSCLGLEIGDG